MHGDMRFSDKIRHKISREGTTLENWAHNKG